MLHWKFVHDELRLLIIIIGSILFMLLICCCCLFVFLNHCIWLSYYINSLLKVLRLPVPSSQAFLGIENILILLTIMDDPNICNLQKPLRQE